MSRIPVKFKKTILPRNRLKQLHICKKCNIYTLLPNEICSYCSSSKGCYTLEQFTSKKFRRQFLRDTLFLISILIIAIIFTFNFTAILIIGSLGLTCILIYMMMKFTMRDYEKNFLLSKLLLNETKLLKNGLEINKEFAIRRIHEGKYLEAYEILRLIGLFLDDESIKELKTSCLSQFIIQKNMPLEMDTIIPNSFNTIFVAYLARATKLQHDLVNKKVLNYVIAYEEEIQEHFSNDIFITVAGAALRRQEYFLLYEGFIMKHINELSRERILRLCKILENIDHYECERSKILVNDLIRMKYEGIPAVKVMV